MHRFSRDTGENRMEGVKVRAARFSRAENWTLLSAKCLAQMEELGIRFRVALQTAPRWCIWSQSPGNAGWPSSFYCWETDSSELCSGAVKKSGLGGVDSALHNRECSGGKGESEEKPRLSSAGCQDTLHWGLVPFPAPGARLAAGSPSGTE